MKIVLGAVMYSPNLGDGLIADSMDFALRQADPEIQVTRLDLAGRTGFEAPKTSARTRVLDLLARAPGAISEPIASSLVQYQVARKLTPRLPLALFGAQLLVIGGGQLLADANLNFPHKLAALTEAAEAQMLPIALHSVGVSKHWGRRGRRLFGRLLGSPNLRAISVRDDASARHLTDHYRDLGLTAPCEIKICPDPAVLAGLLSGVQVFDPQQRGRHVGIGVVHPAALATHAETGQAMSMDEMTSAYLRLCEALMARGMKVHVFTNGAGEDEQMLDHVHPILASSLPVRRVPRADTPKTLLEVLGGLDAVVSHRLHACIGANAMGRKAVGLRWDGKMDAYFAMTGQSEDLFDDLRKPERIAQSLAMPISAPAQAELTALKPTVFEGARHLVGLAKGSAPARPHATGPEQQAARSYSEAQSQPEPEEKRSSSARFETRV